MGNYMADVYPHRNDLHRFVNLLLRALPAQYTENLEFGYSNNKRPGSGNRIPQELDKVRVRALLDAWNRHISDRYLDFPRVQTLDRGFDPRLGLSVAVRQARHLIDQNAPQGAVKFIYNELSRDRDVTEARMSDRGSYNWMYSALLVWCDRRCYSLVNEIDNFLQRTGGAGGGNSALPIIYQAALQHIVGMYRLHRTVYSRYFNDRTAWSYFQPV